MAEFGENDFYVHYNFENYGRYGITYHNENGDKDINSAYELGHEKLNLFNNYDKNSVQVAKELEKEYNKLLNDNSYKDIRNKIINEMKNKLYGNSDISPNNILQSVENVPQDIEVTMVDAAVKFRNELDKIIGYYKKYPRHYRSTIEKITDAFVNAFSGLEDKTLTTLQAENTIGKLIQSCKELKQKVLTNFPRDNVKINEFNIDSALGQDFSLQDLIEAVEAIYSNTGYIANNQGVIGESLAASLGVAVQASSNANAAEKIKEAIDKGVVGNTGSREIIIHHPDIIEKQVLQKGQSIKGKIGDNIDIISTYHTSKTDVILDWSDSKYDKTKLSVKNYKGKSKNISLDVVNNTTLRSIINSMGGIPFTYHVLNYLGSTINSKGLPSNIMTNISRYIIVTGVAGYNDVDQPDILLVFNSYNNSASCYSISEIVSNLIWGVNMHSLYEGGGLHYHYRIYPEYDKDISHGYEKTPSDRNDTIIKEYEKIKLSMSLKITP